MGASRLPGRIEGLKADEAESLLSEALLNTPEYTNVDRIFISGLIDRFHAGDVSIMVLRVGGKADGAICYRVVDREAELYHGWLSDAYTGGEGAFLEMAVEALATYGVKAVRSGFAWPLASRFAMAAPEAGFRQVRRMSMARDVDDSLIFSYRPAAGVVVLPWSTSYFEEICRIMHEATEDFDRLVYPMFGSPDGSRALIISIFQDNHGVFMPELSSVALSGGKVGGFLLASLLPDNSVLILDIAVDQGCRRKGIGTRMLEYLFSKCAMLGYPRIVLAVTMSNLPAIRLYEKMGFRAGATFDQHVLLIPEAGTPSP